MTALIAAAIAAFAVVAGRRLRLWHAGTHTEYAGPGRVVFISFFRGAGYCVVLRRGRGRDGKPLNAPGWRPNVAIPGFTVYLRLKRSSRAPHWDTPVRWFRITANPNQAVV